MDEVINKLMTMIDALSTEENQPAIIEILEYISDYMKQDISQDLVSAEEIEKALAAQGAEYDEKISVINKEWEKRYKDRFFSTEKTPELENELESEIEEENIEDVTIDDLFEEREDN